MKECILKATFLVLMMFTGLAISAQPTTPQQCIDNWDPPNCSTCVITACGCTIWTYCGSSTTNDECRIYVNCPVGYYAVDFIDDDTNHLWASAPNTSANTTFSEILVRGGNNFSGNFRLELINTPPTQPALACTTAAIAFNCL